MKIKPPDHSGPPVPLEPESSSSATKPASTSQSEAKGEVRQTERRSVAGTDVFEIGLQEVAELNRKLGIPKEAAVAKVVDTVLEQVLGKDFLSRPEATSVREALTPLISSDEYLMGKLNSILSRLGNKS